MFGEKVARAIVSPHPDMLSYIQALHSGSYTPTSGISVWFRHVVKITMAEGTPDMGS